MPAYKRFLVNEAQKLRADVRKGALFNRFDQDAELAQALDPKPYQPPRPVIGSVFDRASTHPATRLDHFLQATSDEKLQARSLKRMGVFQMPGLADAQSAVQD